MGKNRLEHQFDELCCKAIEEAMALTAARTDGVHDQADIARASLEKCFEHLRDQARLIRAFMVIDLEIRPAVRGIINVQDVIGDGYARYQFNVERGRINITVSHVRPRYV